MILTFACGKKNKTWTEYDLNCGKAYVTEILGYNSYFGGGKDIIVKCNVIQNGTEFKSELVIDISVIGEAYCPFKVGDSVVAKYLKTDKKIAELYLLKRYNNRDNYWMDRYYTFNDVCENGKQYRSKRDYSRGKIE